MSKENRSKEQKDIDNNPCGTCRAFGLPVCKCRRGAGGNETGDDNLKKDTAPTPQNIPTNVEINALSSYLENSDVWISKNDFIYHFNNDAAILSIVLDTAGGLIHFKGNQFLSANDKKDLNELYDKIENEFKQFKEEVNAQNMSIFRDETSLRISIPDHKLYDQFVTRLLNKNLIPDNNYSADPVYKTNHAVGQTVSDKEVSNYQSPNPFDISNGPRPTNDSKKN